MIASALASVFVLASVVCENGVCRLVPDETNVASVVCEDRVGGLPSPDRIAQGVLSEEELLDFLSDDATGRRAREWGDGDDGRPFALIILLAILGGLAMNLTPCVLPMVPVNLIVIGASVRRGVLYGLGQFLTFGSLGLAAAFGGTAFGTIQSSPWFNLAVAVLFAALAVSLFGFYQIDFARFRRRGRTDAFFLGAVSALLAGACVAPVLVSVLLLTARLAAEGSAAGFVLPFAVAFGLALPWPFLGAGLKILPRPGAWMKWVNRAFALLVAAFAVHYLLLAAAGFRTVPAAPSDDMTPQAFSQDVRLTEPRTRPLLVFCHADWCKNCPAMERLLSSSPRVREALRAIDVVRLKLDRPDDLAVLPGFGDVRGIPAVALYLPKGKKDQPR